MATATLVNSDIEIGRRIVAALTRAAIPVAVYLWAFIPEIQEWQFIIATPLVDSKGPLAAYGEVNKALQKEGVFGDVPLRRIFLKSPSDKVLRSLEKESKAVPREAFRVLNKPIAGSFVEDAYLYTGFIHIVQLQKSDPSSLPIYSVIYAPYEGPGGAVPAVKVRGADELQGFLLDALHIDREWVSSAIRDLGQRASATIPNVQLRAQELRRLGLA